MLCNWRTSTSKRKKFYPQILPCCANVLLADNLVERWTFKKQHLQLKGAVHTTTLGSITISYSSRRPGMWRNSKPINTVLSGPVTSMAIQHTTLERDFRMPSPRSTLFRAKRCILFCLLRRLRRFCKSLSGKQMCSDSHDYACKYQSFPNEGYKLSAVRP